MSVRHYDAFKADLRTINRRFRKRTSSLRGLLEYLKASRDRPEPMANVAEALGHCRNGTDRRIQKYEPAIGRVVSVWGTDEPYPVEPKAAVRESVAGKGAARALVQSARRDLDRMKGYVSGDALTFRQCINPQKKDEIEANARDFLSRPRVQVGGTAAAVVGLGSPEWKSSTLRRSYDIVTKNKAGVCTTFAHTAAHVLEQRRSKARIEVVAHRNHVFVVVGREGGYEVRMRTYRLPSYKTWQGDWYIVDGWAGAMGFDVVYRKTAGYPYLSMITNLTLVMASDFEE